MDISTIINNSPDAIQRGIADRVKERRLELNLTLEDVSKKLSISKPTLQRYESGVISNIPSDKIEKLAAILETTPSCLMGWEEKIVKPSIELSEDEMYSFLSDRLKEHFRKLVK